MSSETFPFMQARQTDILCDWKFLARLHMRTFAIPVPEFLYFQVDEHIPTTDQANTTEPVFTAAPGGRHSSVLSNTHSINKGT